MIFIDRIALAKHVDNVLGYVRPSVCLSVCAIMFKEYYYQSIDCVCNQGAHADNLGDAVDQLLMF